MDEAGKSLLDSFEVYLKSQRVSPSTLKTYMQAIKPFVKSIKDPLSIDEEDARMFLATLYDGEQNTAYKVHYALAAFFKSQHIPFNIPAPQMNPHPKRLMITPDDMHTLITSTKEAGDLNEKGILAMSSTYGVRKIELLRMNKNDLNIANKTILIRTAKGGRERVHLVPDVVFNYIAGYDFLPRSGGSLRNMFWSMVRRAGLVLDKGYGFHSIRRALFTGLEGKVDYFYRHEFMRWWERSFNLDSIYSQTPPAKIDELVFKAHPFLPFWANI
jgi:integrase